MLCLPHFGIGLIPWSPMGMGLLGGILRKTSKGRSTTPFVKNKIDSLLPQLKAWELLCDEMGEKPSDVALAWLLHNPVVTSIISGVRTEDQLTQNFNSLSIVLDSEILKKIDSIWPGPGGEAPEAYAW